MRKTDLVPISASTFYEGMYIDSEIYFKYKNNYILLCRDVLLNSELILKLRQTEYMSQTLYVDKKNMGDIMEQSKRFEEMQKEEEKKGAQRAPIEPPPMREVSAHLGDLQAKIKLQEDYHEITNQTSSVMEEAARNNSVPQEMSEGLTQTVSERLELTDTSVLLQCINNLRKADDYLHAHSTNVSMLNGMIGRWMGLSAEEVTALVKTGLLHDIGKLYIPKEILNKPAKLTPEEYNVVKRHPVDSYDVLLNSGETDERVLLGVRQHHERVNGTGYPDGIKDIHLFARITAVSDVYDAMVARRPYRARSSPFDILAEFAQSRFSDLDLSIVDVFLKNMPQELVDKRVILSDGRTAKVVYINASDFAHPIVRVGKQLITTNHNLKCVSMDNFLSILN